MASERLFSAYPPLPDSVPTTPIPQIHLSKLVAHDSAEAERLFTACRTLGFFLLDLQEERIGKKLLGDIEKLFGIAKEVMSLSLQEKTKYEAKPPVAMMGYKPQGLMTNEKGKPDRVQFFNIGQDDILGDEAAYAGLKPIEENRKTFSAFLRNARPLIELMLGNLDTKLGLAKGTFASLQRQDRPSGSLIRLTEYAPRSPNEQDSGSALLGHTDYGTITLLCNVLGGLQILPPGAANTDENWVSVKPVPRNIIVNLGDAMVEWTGDILRSNEHRVVYAPGKQAKYPAAHRCFFGSSRENGVYEEAYWWVYSFEVEDGQEGVSMTAEEWEKKKVVVLRDGADCARSKGGREFELLGGRIGAK